MKLERSVEIGALALQVLIMDDRESAIEFIYDQMNMTIEECGLFGVELTEDELELYEWERTCPICGRRYSSFPALSRKDNKTYICSQCGLEEAMTDFLKEVIKND